MTVQYGQFDHASRSSGNCKGCGYDLRAHRIGNRCPECGRTTLDFAKPKFGKNYAFNSSSETGSGLLKLSLILAVIPISGSLMIAKFGAILAFLAAFGPIFHLVSVWSFRSSNLSAIPEAEPWRKNWIPAAVETLVAVFAIFAAIHLQSQVKATPAWLAVLLIWPPILGIRLAMTAKNAHLIFDDYGLRVLSIIAICTALASILAGIGIGVTTLAVIYQTNQAIAMQYAIPGALVFGGLGLVCCWLINKQAQFVEANLIWDVLNQDVNSREEAQTALSARLEERTPKKLPSIPLVGDDE